MRLAGFILVAACAMPFAAAASRGTAVTAPAADDATVAMPPLLAQTSVAASDRSDFGLRALQLTKQRYVAGDSDGARRSLAEATDALRALAQGMSAPGRGEVWMLVNDLRLIRLVEGGASPGTLHSLSDAEARASALAVRYPDTPTPYSGPRN